MNNKRGFTLIELIVAVSLVAMVSVFVAGFITPLFRTYGKQEKYNFVSNQANTALMEITQKLQFADAATIGSSGGTGLDKRIFQGTDAVSYETGERFNKSFFDGCTPTITFERIADQTIEVTIYCHDGDTDVTTSATVKLDGTGSAGVGTNGGSASSDKIAYHITEPKDLENHKE